MKASHEISPLMPDNAAAFKEPFFKRFETRPAPQPLRFSDALSKTYLFPTLYRDVTCAIGIFPCSYEKARKLLPDRRMKPVRFTKGRALAAFSCYEYKQVLNVAPYNEIAMTIPVLFDSPLDLPLLPMVMGRLYPGFGYYVFGMPVTSKENQVRGNKIWGLPKTTREIETREEGGEFAVSAFEASGESSFELRVPMNGKPTEFDLSADIYSVLDGALLASRTSFQARFDVVKNPDRGGLSLGMGPDAAALRELDIEPRAFQYRFARGMRAAFDLPRKSFPLHANETN